MSADGTDMHPYRVEWRANLDAMWMLCSEHDRHEVALKVMRGQVREFNGQARIVSQHVIEIMGLGA